MGVNNVVLCSKFLVFFTTRKGTIPTIIKLACSWIIIMKTDIKQLGYVITKRDSDSWYTPEKYIQKIKNVFDNRIDLDPFSSIEANRIIQSSMIYTVEDDGLSKEWNATNIFCNPPYSKGMMQLCVNKIIEQYNDEKNIILLCNASTDTKWFHQIMNISDMMCLTLGRISFYNVDGKNVSGNTKGQCFFLLSNDENVQNKFIIEFEDVGKIIRL